MKNKGTRIAALFMAMLVMSMFAIAPAMACAPQGPQEPIDKSAEKKILKLVAEEISLPEEYSISKNPDTGGFIFSYQESADSFKLYDISKNYEITEVWSGTSSVIVGGYQVSLVSDKGQEISVNIAGDSTSNSGKITVYDSASGMVTTQSIDCYELCMGTCAGLGGQGCGAACPYLCGVLAPTGVGYVACVGICLGICFVDITVYCDAICDAVC
ncbi:hypothetical protein [Methanohalophilus portucalensis]|uniref:Uncharacterized protein n=2 Tax=Methanohalophilus portucalensis TaxID=39664 RepID=A0A1L9C6Y1_9EURY|nr:hypothetical protein [Methanohalophilus portucalensis]ATU08873.1 hypothetical protein BKM01_08895 [Methanohalophilus portucalensis]OJH50273.1 hypothetical protein MPF_0061 [Methanohalophilus portucalensis FDF-1]RNI11279.1 hypothetical protein EFE41_06920 [Methanohalophilus portucalensis FDF-1]SMH28591.1 hypothetical protein SAMN06264941_0064 [Methanohalophilus portucalensis FDF-1]